MLLSSIGVSLSILLYGMASAQSFVPTAYHSSLLYGSNLYIFGGYVGKETDKYQKMTSQVAALDLTKDFSLESSPAWSVKSPLPMPIKGPQLAVDGNNGIVLWGGVVPDNVATRKDKVNDAVYRYSIADDKWTKVSEGNPNGRAWPCEYRLATPNSKRLYFGGKKDPTANTTNDICYYENGNTQCKSTPNAPRSRHSCVFQEFKPQKYILIGGAIEEDNTLGDIWTFDEPSSAWTLQSGKVSTRSSMNSIMYDKYLIVFGGWPNNNGTSILIDVIDTETFQVTKPQHTGSFPSWNIFYDPTLVLIGNTLLVYGGYSDTTNAVNPTIEVININSNQNGLLSFEWTKSYKANQTALASIPRGPLPEGDTNASQQSSSNLPIIVGSVVGAAALVAVAGFLLYRRRTTQRKPVQSFSKPSEEVKNIPQALPQNANLAEPTQHPVLHLSQVYETASTRTSVISTQDHHNSPSHNTPFQNNQAPHLQHNPPVADIYSKHNLPSQYYQPYLDTSGQRNMLVLSSDPHPYMYPSSNRTSIASYSQPPMTYSNIAQQPQLYAPVTQTSKLHSQSSEAPPVEVLSSSSLPTTPTQRTNLPPTSDVSQQASNQEPAMPVYQPATPGPSNVKRDGHQYEVSPIQHQMR